MKQRRLDDEAAAETWAVRAATISEWARKVVVLLTNHQVPAEHTLHDGVGGQKVRIASGWLVLAARTPAHPGVFKEAGIFLTPAGELWQYDNEWPTAVRLTATIPAFRTDFGSTRFSSSRNPSAVDESGAEGSVLKARCEWLMDNAIEAFADTLERHGIDVFELEGL